MIHLHVHSTFSFLDGFGTPEQIAARAKDLGQSAIALTDHGNICGHVRFNKACSAADIKPIFGCEAYCVESVANNERRKGHMTLLAMDNQGYRNLTSLMTLANQEGHFYYRPTIDLEDLGDHSEGLIAMTGCLYGLVPTLIRNDQQERAKNILIGLQSIFKDRLFLEVQPFSLEDSRTVNKAMLRFSQDLGLPLLATGDVHYPRPEDEEMQGTLVAIRQNIPLANLGSFQPMHQSTEEELSLWFAKNHPYHDWTEAILATEGVAARCNVRLDMAPELRFSDASDDERQALMRQLINEGWVNRDIAGNSDADAYRDRVVYEYDLIVKKGYVDYFLIVADIINWAKHNNILVGPARGSAAGSLVCYLMGITEVDPMKYDLLFERFIDITREDPPDVDVDFEDRYRERVKQYMRERFGHDCVANLSAYVTFKGKNALDDIARIEKIPGYKVSRIKNVLIFRSGGDSRASFTIEDTLAEFPAAKAVVEEYPVLKRAAAIEGQIRGLTVHAAGMVVCNEPLVNYTSILREGQVCINHKDAAALGMLKIDVLGISTLSVVHRCIERLGMSIYDLYALPLSDPEVFAGFNEGLFKGIFQWEGGSTQSVTRQLDVQNFEQLIDINALSRPGPLHCGATTKYVAGNSEPVHPTLDAITANTRGQVLYQEQVMRTMREVGLMSWEDTALIRMNISKKEGVEAFNRFWNKFVKGATSQGVPEETAKAIWDNVCTFGSWAFNRSHSVSYAILAYWCMWLKVHHPLEFYWANLVQDPRDVGLIRECMRTGIEILPVRVGKSRAEWTIEDGALRAGFLSLKGIGEKAATTLESPNPRITPSLRGLLNKAGAFDQTEDTADFMGLQSFTDRLNSSPATHKIGELDYGHQHVVSIVGLVKERNLRSLNELAYSKNWGDKPTYRPDLDQWVNVLLEDDTGMIHCKVDRMMYPRVKGIIWEGFEEGDLYLVRGIKEEGFRRVRVKSIINWSAKHEPREQRLGPAGTSLQLALFEGTVGVGPRQVDRPVSASREQALPSTG